jgi:hypothetical protein
MAVVGLPLMIWGLVWVYQGYAQKQQETIAEGIRLGVREGLRAEQGLVEPMGTSREESPAEAGSDWEEQD